MSLKNLCQKEKSASLKDLGERKTSEKVTFKTRKMFFVNYMSVSRQKSRGGKRKIYDYMWVWFVVDDVLRKRRESRGIEKSMNVGKIMTRSMHFILFQLARRQLDSAFRSLLCISDVSRLALFIGFFLSFSLWIGHKTQLLRRLSGHILFDYWIWFENGKEREVTEKKPEEGCMNVTSVGEMNYIYMEIGEGRPSVSLHQRFEMLENEESKNWSVLYGMHEKWRRVLFSNFPSPFASDISDRRRQRGIDQPFANFATTTIFDRFYAKSNF